MVARSGIERIVEQTERVVKKLKIYLDASVIGGCLDDEFKDASVTLTEMIRRREVIAVVSDLFVAEIRRAPEEVIAVFTSLPLDAIEDVTGSDESLALAKQYLAAGVVGPTSFADAHHVAIATVSRSDLIVSWNFKHIVHYDKIRGFNSVNMREGYPAIDIRSPREVI